LNASQLFFLLFSLLGGLAIFILGMNIMTEGLRLVVGANLQPLLAKTTRNRFAGLGLGTFLGATIHSGATMVMLLGFVNAGLLTLEQTIAPMLGANIGTTLSMQMVSFHINDYAFFAITIGLILSLAGRDKRLKELGRTLLGFGLLFLGMDIISNSIKPHKEVLAQYLIGIDGTTLIGVLIGVTVSLGLTVIWQSSGATVAIVFAMVNAGIFTKFSQVFPIVLGAHLGTCTTALLASVGTNIEARRTAMAHLVFNIFNVTLAIMARPLFYYFIPMTSSDLVRQTANLHTFVMLFAAVFVIPFVYLFARMVRFIAFSRKMAPESSYLDYQLLEYPEQAIVAVIKELQRVSRICSNSLYLTGHVILNVTKGSYVSKIKMNEQVVDDIKLALREYLMNLTKKHLSRRQIIMSHHLNNCMTDLERIGDHIDQLCDLSLKQHQSPEAGVDKESFDALFCLYKRASKILDLVTEALRPETPSYKDTAAAIVKSCDEYNQCSTEIKENFMHKVEGYDVNSIAALYFNEYVFILDRTARHISNIACSLMDKDFCIKQSRLDERSKHAAKTVIYSYQDTDDYLNKLRKDSSW
jgi:phosphate:Na+ symporter